MSWDDPFWWPHSVTVQVLTGRGGMGATFAAGRTVVAEVRDEQRLVRDRDGQEVVSSTQVTVPLAANVPVGSWVTVWPGGAAERTAEVLAVARDDNSDVDLGSHLILSLT